jgi:oligopeptide/dipeptide ABC transporter ATP-binding protein
VIAPLVEARAISRSFVTRRTFFGRSAERVNAVDSVSLSVERGETLGLVGESGSGKSTLGRLLLRLIEPQQGTIAFDGRDITRLNGSNLRALRRDMSFVFQDPYSSLDPSWTVGRIVAEPLKVQQLADGDQREELVVRMLEQVGLSRDHVHNYPHEFSGGQRQRIGIARALVTHPRFVVCDEPVSALDLSTRAQILALLQRLQADLGLTYMLISHDLSVIRAMCDHVAVMYLGQIVEYGPTEALVNAPAHPYTAALLSAAPFANPLMRTGRRRIVISGDAPSPVRPPSGCRFHPRCPLAMPVCSLDPPEPRDVGADHWVSCHLHSQSPRDSSQSILDLLHPPLRQTTVEAEALSAHTA